MNALYTEEDLTNVRGQLRRRMIFLAAALILGAGLTAWTLILDNHKDYRPEILTTLAVILTGSAGIFIWDMLISPIRAYARHVEASLHGRTHEVTAAFDHEKEETSEVDGVSFRELIFVEGEDRTGDMQRVFYWDREKPMPDFAKGQEVVIQYYDRTVTGWSPAV